MYNIKNKNGKQIIAKYLKKMAVEKMAPDKKNLFFIKRQVDSKTTRVVSHMPYPIVENAMNAGVIKKIKAVMNAVFSSNNSLDIKNTRKTHNELVIKVNILPAMNDVPKTLNIEASKQTCSGGCAKKKFL